MAALGTAVLPEVIVGPIIESFVVPVLSANGIKYAEALLPEAERVEVQAPGASSGQLYPR